MTIDIVNSFVLQNFIMYYCLQNQDLEEMCALQTETIEFATAGALELDVLVCVIVHICLSHGTYMYVCYVHVFM